MSAPAAARKLTVALVAPVIDSAGTPAGTLAKYILAGHDRFDFVVVSRTLAPELRPLVDWRRAPAPAGPLRLRWAVFFLTAGARLARLRVDVVHAYGPAPSVPNRVDLFSANYSQAAFHENVGGRPASDGRLTWRAVRALALALERWGWGSGRASLIDVDTPAAKAELERHYPRARVVVTQRVIDTEQFRPDPEARRAVRAELGVPEDEFVCLFSGRNWAAKGLHDALAGMAEARRRGVSGKLWVLGIEPKTVARKLARQWPTDGVRVLGLQPEVLRYCQAADIFVLPSYYETFSRAAYEAAACELPLVATPMHGIAELIGDDEAGIAVDWDPGSIGAAIARLAGDTELRARMGRAGRSRCVAIPDRMAEQTFAHYEQLAREKGRAG